MNILLEDAIAMYPTERLFVIGDTQAQIEEFAANNVQCCGVVQRIARWDQGWGIRSSLPLIILPMCDTPTWVKTAAYRYERTGSFIVLTQDQVRGRDPVGVPLDRLGLV
jgi:hypothetical protein